MYLDNTIQSDFIIYIDIDAHISISIYAYANSWIDLYQVSVFYLVITLGLCFSFCLLYFFWLVIFSGHSMYFLYLASLLYCFLNYFLVVVLVFTIYIYNWLKSTSRGNCTTSWVVWMPYNNKIILISFWCPLHCGCHSLKLYIHENIQTHTNTYV